MCVSQFLLLSTERSFSFLSVGTLVSAIIKNGHSSQKCILEQHSQLVWAFSFPSVNRIRKLVLVIKKVGKMAVASHKCVLDQTFPITNPLKFGSPVCQVTMEIENW